MNTLFTKTALLGSALFLMSGLSTFSFAQDHLPSQVDAIVTQALSLDATPVQDQIEKLTIARGKIGKAMLANPSNEVFHTLEEIQESLERLISRHIRTTYIQERLPSELQKLDELHTATNTLRRERRLAPLQINEKLNKVAEMIANDMATYNVVSDQTPHGITVSHRLQAVGYEGTYQALNLSHNETDATTVIESWSTGGRQERHLFNQQTTEVGYGYNPVAHHRVAIYGKQDGVVYYKIGK